MASAAERGDDPTQRWGTLRACLCEARRPPMAVWTCAVVGAWTVAALAMLLAAPTVLSFQPAAHPAAVGWVTVHAYPKHQEGAYFLMAACGVPGVVLAGWWSWVFASAGLSKLGAVSVRTTLRQSAAALCSFYAAVPCLLRFDSGAWRVVAGAGVAVLGLPLLCLAWNRRRSGAKRSVAPQVCPAPLEPANGRRRPAWLWLPWGLFCVALPAMLYALTYRGYIDGAVDLFHEGEFLVPLNEMLHGGVPFRDMHLQHGLLHNAWIPWIGSRLYGPTLAGVRLGRRLVDPLGGCAGILLVVSLFRARALSAAAFGLIACGTGFVVPGRAAIGLVAIAVAGRAVGGPRGLHVLGEDGAGSCRPSRLWRSMRRGGGLVTAGFLAMLAFWQSVEVGIYTLAALFLFAGAVGFLQPGVHARRRALPLVLLGAGAFAGFWSIGVYLAWQGALPGLFRTVVLQCAHQSETWGLPFPNFFEAVLPLRARPVEAQWPGSFTRGPLLWYLPVGLIVALGVALVQRWARGALWCRPAALRLLLLFIAACCYFRTVLGRSDSSHLAYGVLFMVLVAMLPADQAFGLAWEHVTGAGRTWRQRMPAAPWLALGIVFAWPVCTYVDAAYKPVEGLRDRWQRLREPRQVTRATSEPVGRAGEVVLGGQADRIRAVAAAIRERVPSDREVFDFSNQAGLLFFADRRSATRYFQVAYASTESAQREVIADLERQRTPLVIWRTGSWADTIDGLTQAQRHPLIHAYIESHYEPDTDVCGVELYRRRSPAQRP